MKFVDIDVLDNLPGRRLEGDDTFSFRCHKGLACFNQCCRHVNLFLYPYDVIRLKRNLGISSDQFLDEYIDIVLRPASFFPEVVLRMSANSDRTCPFLNESGCLVYPDRPDTCRSFPVEQGIIFDRDQQRTHLIHFFRPPDFCMGQYEKKVWTTQSWSKDQQAVFYSKMTSRWAEVKRSFKDNPWGREGMEGPKAKMAFMATYNIDRFRDFVFNSSFLKRYKVKSAILKKSRTDDVELLKLGFNWVMFFVWGIKNTSIRIR